MSTQLIQPSYATARHAVVCQWPRKTCGTSVLFTGTTKSPFLTPHISITTAWANFYQIYTFYAIRYIRNPIHIKFEGNWLSSSQGTCP